MTLTELENLKIHFKDWPQVRALIAEVERLRNVVARLALNEAFGTPFAVPNNPCGDELKARLNFARNALE